MFAIAIISGKGEVYAVVAQKFDGVHFVFALGLVYGNSVAAALFGEFHGRDVGHAIAKINHSAERDGALFIGHKLVNSSVF